MRETITIGEQTFEADSEFVPLLRELNRAGLHTTQHCCGHGDGRAYLSIVIPAGMEIGIRHDPGTEVRLIIRWAHRRETAKSED